MKRLWLILFVVPLFAQENPCENEEYLKLKKKIDSKGILEDIKEFEIYWAYYKSCRDYKQIGKINPYTPSANNQKSNTPSKVLQEPAQTENNQKSNFPLIISVNINGNHEWSYQNESIDRDVDMGFSGALEGYLIKGGGLKIGFGVEYMLIRDVKNNGGGIKFKSGYGIVKISPSGNSGNLYLKGKYGFNVFTGDANYSSGLQSVIYGGKTMYGIGGELYFSPNTFIELMAITNTGEVIVLGGTFDIKYTYFNVGLGYSI
jgi:hypothetical protein